ncbi:MAG TPA: type II secretion system protein GspN [Myxococcota bacterium]|nr:type II secretion system protein GspN [Myxococcota bacterium]
MRPRERSVAGRLLRALGVALLSVLAVAAIALLFLPYERAAPALGAAIERETRIATQIAELGGGVSARGPYLEARGVALRWPTGETLALDSLRISPALSLSWLRGVPQLHVTLSGPFGDFDGSLSRELMRGDLSRFDLAQLPASWFGAGGAWLAGAVEARVHLARLSEQWSGSVQLDGGEGSLALPGAPIAIPYETITAMFRLDEVGTLRIESLALAGPMVSARAHGEIAAGYAGPATGAIAIDADVDRIDPALLPALAQYGVALGETGAGHLTISGTPDQLLLTER